MSDDQTELLAKRTIEDGEVIFSKGDIATEAFVVQRGEIELMEQDADGFFETVRIVGPGQSLGEGALISPKPRKLSARAKGPAACIVVSRDIMEAKLDEADGFIRGMFRVLLGNFSAVRDIDAEAKDSEETERDLKDLEVEEDTEPEEKSNDQPSQPPSA